MKQIVIILSFVSMALFAQSTRFSHYLALKTNLMAPIDVLTFPSIDLSLEKNISPYLTVSIGGGYQLFGFRQGDTVAITPKGYKTHVELRFYLENFFSKGKKQKPEGLFIGVQSFYRYSHYAANFSYLKTNDTTRYEDEVGVKKVCFGLNFIGGYQKSFNRFVVDGYFGIGIMDRKIENSERQFNPSNGDHLKGTDLVPLFQRLNLSERSEASLNLTFGIQMGYFLINGSPKN